MFQNGSSDHYEINEPPGTMSPTLHAALLKAGAKLDNPSPEITEFGAPEEWKIIFDLQQGCVIAYDERQHARFRYYPVIPEDSKNHYVPTDKLKPRPRIETILRYVIEKRPPLNDFRYAIFDRRLGSTVGQPWDTPEQAESLLDITCPGWREGGYWDDPESERWWQRLLFWRR